MKDYTLLLSVLDKHRELIAVAVRIQTDANVGDNVPKLLAATGNALFENINRLPAPNYVKGEHDTDEFKACQDLLSKESNEQINDHLYDIPPKWIETVMGVALARDILGGGLHGLNINHTMTPAFGKLFDLWGELVLAI